MKTLKLIKRLFLLCLIMAGTQSAWADSGNKLVNDAVTVGNLTFDLYRYIYYDGTLGSTFAVLKDISGITEEVVVPDTIRDGSTEYVVNYIDGTISNSYVKKITFKSDIYFYSNDL